MDSKNSSIALTAAEWLESPYLARLAGRVGVQYGLRSEDVADLLQEVRLALWKAGPELRVNVSWIFRTAAHKAADYWRRRSRQRERVLDLPDSLQSRGRENAELVHLLRARAALLPEALRAFYALRYEEGRSEREIAARLGLCRGSIRWMDQRCRGWLQGHSAQSRRSLSVLARPA